MTKTHTEISAISSQIKGGNENTWIGKALVKIRASTTQLNPWKVRTPEKGVNFQNSGNPGYPVLFRGIEEIPKEEAERIRILINHTINDEDEEPVPLRLWVSVVSRWIQLEDGVLGCDQAPQGLDGLLDAGR